jgi:hypothetical protein
MRAAELEILDDDEPSDELELEWLLLEDGGGGSGIVSTINREFLKSSCM